VSLTPVANEKIFNQKILIILLEHPWIVELTYIYCINFCLQVHFKVSSASLFATGVADTGGKFAAGVVSCEYLREFLKKFQTALMVYSRAWGKLIHEKNQKQKIS
jgi:hypothetical protein